MLICPVCQSAMHTASRQLVCGQGHSFDQAKQGYYNLLLNQAKKSKQPGDTANMVKARKHFLNAGHYQSISDCINQQVIDYLWQEQEIQVLDLGCGEGYYTERLHHSLSDHQIDHTLIGLDISKEAIKQACKRQGHINWLVANAKAAPVQPHSQHLILNIFNRIMPQTLFDLCHEQGIVVIVSSGKHHLMELKQAIYNDPRFNELDVTSLMAPYFAHEHNQQLDFNITLNNTDLQYLLAMTPHVWRSSNETQQGLAQTEQLSLRVQVNVDVFKPKSVAS
ncbi:putative RNA methyltransferase [Bermanella sp. R86510]|uniref:putative RNA methyltransferase n=1 Tax=unclassified Bermanella TaxID=2627862 RepID=UPI0037C9093A